MRHRKPLYVLAALAVTAGGLAAGLGLRPSLAAAAQCLYVGDPSCEQDSTTPSSGTGSEGTYNAPPPQYNEDPWPCPQDYYFGWNYTTSAPVGSATFFIRYGTFYRTSATGTAARTAWATSGRTTATGLRATCG